MSNKKHHLRDIRTQENCFIRIPNSLVRQHSSTRQTRQQRLHRRLRRQQAKKWALIDRPIIRANGENKNRPMDVRERLTRLQVRAYRFALGVVSEQSFYLFHYNGGEDLVKLVWWMWWMCRKDLKEKGQKIENPTHRVRCFEWAVMLTVFRLWWTVGNGFCFRIIKTIGWIIMRHESDVSACNRMIVEDDWWE